MGEEPLFNHIARISMYSFLFTIFCLPSIGTSPGHGPLP